MERERKSDVLLQNCGFTVKTAKKVLFNKLSFELLLFLGARGANMCTLKKKKIIIN